MLSITELVINRGVNSYQIIKLIFYLLPGIIFIVLPAAALVATLTAFLRLSSDNEVIVLKSSGISLYQILPPVISLSLIGYIIASLIAFYGLPWGNRSLKDEVFKIAESRADVEIKERIFFEPFDDVVFYVNNIVSGKRIMKDVFVIDNRDSSMKQIIVAKESRILISQGASTIVVHFTDGTIFMSNKDFQTIRTLEFRDYDLKIGLEDIMASLAARKRAPKEMFIHEIFQHLRKSQKDEPEYNELMIELLEKFSIPLAVFLMGIIGVPLGTHVKSRSISFGVVLSLGIFLLFYISFLGVKSLCEAGKLTPDIGMWLPNIILLVCCIYTFQRADAEQPILPRIRTLFSDRL